MSGLGVNAGRRGRRTARRTHATTHETSRVIWRVSAHSLHPSTSPTCIRCRKCRRTRACLRTQPRHLRGSARRLLHFRQRHSAYRDRVRCDYFDAGVCSSCTLMGVDYDAQLAGKVAHAERLLAPWTDAAEAQVQWLPPVASRPEAFRNKAKMVVGGTIDAPTLGILDAARRGVDLRGCGVLSEGLRAALPPIAAFITRAQLTPYDIPARRGELKNVLLTESPDGRLMLRFVLRSSEPLARIRKHLPGLLAELPQLAVVTANLLPEHTAVLEG